MYNKQFFGGHSTLVNFTLPPCRKFGTQSWQNFSLNVVDMPEPAILGLPACEVMTLHYTVLMQQQLAQRYIRA